METAYEKVCPACGRSATLAAKFCSGCGHQYRTVFHDQAASSDGNGADYQESESQFDTRWAPVVAITPVLIVAFMVSSSHPAPAPIAAAPTQAAVVSYNATPAVVSSTVSTGMSPGDVRQALGQPDTSKEVSVGGVTTEQWYYSRNGRRLEVDFDSNDVVNSYNWTND